MTLTGTALRRRHPGLSVEVRRPQTGRGRFGSPALGWLYPPANRRGAAGQAGAGRAPGGGVRLRAWEESRARASRGPGAERGAGGG